jgi:hypothetical protein
MMMDELCISMLIVLLSAAIGRILTDEPALLDEIGAAR